MRLSWCGTEQCFLQMPPGLLSRWEEGCVHSFYRGSSVFICCIYCLRFHWNKELSGFKNFFDNHVCGRKNLLEPARVQKMSCTVCLGSSHLSLSTLYHQQLERTLADGHLICATSKLRHLWVSHLISSRLQVPVIVCKGGAVVNT